jgi:Ketopantoate hydroxymethyltransferase
MIHHCKAVARGCKAPFLIGDLPFGSYESNPEDAVKVALRFIKEGNVEVKSMRFNVQPNDCLRMYSFMFDRPSNWRVERKWPKLSDASPPLVSLSSHT